MRIGCVVLAACVSLAPSPAAFAATGQLAAARELADEIVANTIDSDDDIAFDSDSDNVDEDVSRDAASSLPASYAAPVTSVRDQDDYPTCWSFGSLAALESNQLVREGYDGSTDVQAVIDAAASHNAPDYSEANLIYSTYHTGSGKADAFKEDAVSQLGAGDTSGYGYGGNWRETASTMAAGFGPVSEAADPLVTPANVVSVATMTAQSQATWGISERSLLGVQQLPGLTTQDSDGGRDLAPGNRATVKSAIMRYGALAASYWAPSRSSDWHNSGVKDASVSGVNGTVIQVNVTSDRHVTNSWVANADDNGTQVSTNHMVAIAGWDDSYSRFNFMIPLSDGYRSHSYDPEIAEIVTLDVTDSATGATTRGQYIVPREDGAWLIKNSWGEQYGDKGFQWLSYDEKTIERIVTFVSEEKAADNVTEQYDSVDSLSYTQSNTSLSEANVFTASHDEVITRVGLWTLKPDTDVRIRVYDVVEGGSDPTNGNLVYNGKGTITYAGYHVVGLNSSLNFNKGDRYSVVVDLTDSSGKHYFTIEAGKTSAIQAVSSPGESFILYRNKWIDSTLVRDQIFNENYSVGNVRVKAIGTVRATSSVSGEREEMYRLYNPNSGEHFYTADAAERDNLTSAGWSYEGVGWIAPATGEPVYRLYNANAGDHHYTMDASESSSLRHAGWVYEGVSWYSDDPSSGIPVWRQYNPQALSGAHNYTTDEAERLYLTSHGWSDEGAGWYAASAA